MRFALNQMGFPNDGLETNAEQLASAGYDGIEPNLTADGPLWDDDAVAAFGDCISTLELEVPAVSTTLHWKQQLSSPDAETREAGIDAGERMIHIADELNAGAILVVPAIVDEETPYDAAYDRALESVRTLAETAAEYDVTVCIENVWNDFLLSPLEFAQFVDEASEAGPVGAYFDVGNVRRFGRPEQWIRILGDRIERVHVKDYDADVDTIHGFTYPLQGDVDWYAVRDALADIGYDGWLTAEVPPYQTAPERMPPQLLDNLQYVFD
ncbi:sugar phosphate isomerase [Halogeometricum borinquense DSM 11551]|uniref:Sugar phosphate isomerase n=2 Tax=Halogeometricum borinquense TaxID=60847 RepID=E4NVI3_HALBP|nr:sugar phosphate isomerase/epimerase family protein [Halogeometricum borinquense]ADQ68867.1 sugar phosphate isomerase/epimerase [Halogeometricum borinquense DSM 11551]ELY28705.1 sugar phosphate isomerase [Halogeometricum borinquense DSM 11551]RYJ08426.1 sugar phosphate isomerase/epimerase [Halogeometricum borinquense]